MRIQWQTLCLAAIGLIVIPSAARAQDLSVKESDGQIAFYSGDKLITKYHHQGYSKPIFYPVMAPSGVPLTRGWPMVTDIKGEATDHPHQKSVWFTHGDVVAEGKEIKNVRKNINGTDFWAEGHGKIVCVSAKVVKKDKDQIVVVTKNEWISADGEKILEETRTIRVTQLEGAWLIVVESDLFAPTYNIVFDDTKEGSFGIRINEQIIAGKTKDGGGGKGKIQNADGKVGEKACWGYPSAWCDYSGPINEKVAGLAILVDPKNSYPSCFHVRDYGLMAANPFGRKKSGFPAMKDRTDLVRLEKGQHLELRYGVLLHDGDAEQGRVAASYQKFVDLRGK